MIVQLYSVERLNNSVNGNPRFDLHTDSGTFTTSSDSACSYDVENIARLIPGGPMTIQGLTVSLSLTKAKRVQDIVVVGNAV